MINILSICNNYSLARILYIIRKFLDIVQIVGPILTMVALYVNLTHGTVNTGEDGKIRKKIINSLIATVILFFLPAVINLTMGLLADNGTSQQFDLATCWEESAKLFKPTGINGTGKLTSTSSKKKYKSNKKVSKRSIKKIKAKASAKKKRKKPVKNGKKYKLSNYKLRYLAAICKREQGTPSGMRGEANLIANRYELYGKNYSSVYDFVRNSGWFGKSGVTPTNSKKAINVAKSVFVRGNRNVPLYVDEHDCWFCNHISDPCKNGNIGDICKITGGSSKSYITNRKHYKQDKTKITNVYGSKYTFYYFPSSISDPFGYTQRAYNKVKAMNK